MTIKDLPISEMPRERLLKYGASNLSNEDLLSIILRTGTKEKNVKLLSNEILTKIKMIEDMNNLTINELSEIKGLGKVKIVTLLAAIELGKRVGNKTTPERLVLDNAKIIQDYFAHYINSNQEEVMIILVDNHRRLLSYQIMYKGTSNETTISAKEIFHYAIKENATGVIIMHNHPSGEINPSNEDKALTNDLALTGQIVGIKLLDHIITNGQSYFSFFEDQVKDEV